jgi:spermidine/putrescine transport system ATP-binding protein
MAAVCVKLENVIKEFPSCLALDDVSLSITEGEFFSLLGPSGCGKTTTLRIIGGFDQPTRGKVFLDDTMVNDLPPNYRNVNTVFQNYAIFPHMTVYENVAYPLKIKKFPRDQIKSKVTESLNMVSMVGYENRYSQQLSGGQRQRIALARALILNPRVLLLDEPLGALDLQLRQQMQGVLKRLQRELGITFIYVTHDQGEALTMSDKIAVMYQGKVQQVGTARQIYEMPENRFVAQFIGRTNFLEGIFQDRLDEIVHVKMSSYEIKCQFRNFFEKNRHVCVSIRPERIMIGKGLKNLSNILNGRIEDIVYFGDKLEYIIRLGRGDNYITVKRDSSPSLMENGYKIGDVVEIGWNVGEEVLLS